MSHAGSPDADADHGPPVDRSATVVWTRGQQCEILAQELGNGGAVQVGPDLVASCIEQRADILVAKRLTSFALCSSVVPHGFDPSTTTAVVSAVGRGPHSTFAAGVARRLAMKLAVPSTAICGYQHPGEHLQALAVLDDIARRVPGIDTQSIRAPSPAAMVGELNEGTLLVVGAPGGSWFQRQFFGPGVRIRAKASGGTIVVKHIPPRVYQVMMDTTAYGPHMTVDDALKLTTDRHVIVADEGRLVGLCTTESLAAAAAGQELRHVMDEPVFLYADEYIENACDLINQFAGNPIPVLDRSERIVGSVTADDLLLQSAV